MKNLILENLGMQDIPKRLQHILETEFIENREYWTHFRECWWPKNREETTNKFAALVAGDNIVCETVFDGWQQLELMAILLMNSKINKDLNIYIRISGVGLKYKIQEYLDDTYSDVEEDYYDKSHEERIAYKKDMNTIILGVLAKHNVYDLTPYEKTLLNISDFEITV